MTEEKLSAVDKVAEKNTERSVSVTSTMWLEKGVVFRVSTKSIDSLCIFIDSGSFTVGVTDRSAAKNLINALQDAMIRLDENA